MSDRGEGHTGSRWHPLAGPARASASLRATVALVVVVLSVAGALLVYATGGTQHAWAHAMYVPVLLAAWAFGVSGGFVAGIAAGLLLGPLMPLDVAGGTAQPLANWLYRLGFFAGIGMLAGGLCQLLRVQLRRSERGRRWASSVLSGAPDLVVVTDADGRIRYASPSALTFLGASTDELLGVALADRVHPDDRETIQWRTAEGAPERFDVRLASGAGSWRTVELTARDLLADPAVGGVVYNARDVTERRTLQAQVQQLRRYDQATGLVNRAQFTDEVRAALATPPDAPGGGVAVLLLGFERMPEVVKALGPDTGEHLAVALAARLGEHVRPRDVLCRWDTTEFAVLCRDLDDDSLPGLCDRLLDAVREPFLLLSGEVDVGGSVGAALATPHDADPSLLLHRAYLARCRASEAGGSRWELYQRSWDGDAASALDSLRTEHALDDAIARDELTLHYQPVIDLATDRVVAAEALLRWEHPRLGTVPPGDFIPIAEATGAIVAIGDWALREACRQLASWRAHPELAHLAVAVNVSPKQLTSGGLPTAVDAALADSGLPCSALTLEVTESAFVDAAAAVALAEIRRRGVRIAIDDFGTGYSSLASLHRLPADVLKIDRQFVRDLDAHESEQIVSVITALAGKLGLTIIAEGIETVSQLDTLRRLHCQQGQGYLYARPLPATHAVLSGVRSRT